MVNVILITEGVIESNFIFLGDDAAKQAEAKFFELCEENIVNFDEYTPDDKEEMLNDGYEMTINQKKSICISWPEVVQQS